MFSIKHCLLVCMSIWQFVCPSVRLAICLLVRLFVYRLSVCLSVCAYSVYTSGFIFVISFVYHSLLSQSVYLSFSLPVCLLANESVCLCCLSVHRSNCMAVNVSIYLPNLFVCTYVCLPVCVYYFSSNNTSTLQLIMPPLCVTWYEHQSKQINNKHFWPRTTKHLEHHLSIADTN